MNNRPSCTPITRNNRSGVALLLVLVVVVLLATIVVTLSYETQVEATYVSSTSADLDAFLAARSAVATGMSLLAVDAQQGNIADLIAGQPELQTTLTRFGLQLGDKAGALDELSDMGADVDSLVDQWAMDVPPTTLNGALMMVDIADEAGKINLNALLQYPTLATDIDGDVASDAPLNGETLAPVSANQLLIQALRLVFEHRETDVDPTDAILDWVDPRDGDDYGTNIAEEDYYLSLETPFGCQDGFMDSVEELLLIPGITPEEYYGNASVDEYKPPLTDLFTVRGSPDGKINVNTAPYEVLLAICTAWRGQPGFADILIEERDVSPFSSVDTLDKFMVDNGFLNEKKNDDKGQGDGGGEQANGATAAFRAADVFTVNSHWFRIRGDGLSGEQRVRIEAYVWREPANITEQLLTVLDWRVIR